MKTITNNIPRPVLYAWELSPAELTDFDYLAEDEIDFRSFFRYQGQVYDLGDCMAVEPGAELCKGWHGYYGETFFSAVVVKYTDDFESVIVGRVMA